MSEVALQRRPFVDEKGDRLAYVRHLAREFASRACMHDLDRSVPREDIRALADAGLLGLGIPAALGGRGLDLRTITEIISIVAEGNAATALILVMQTSQHGKIADAQTWPKPVRDSVFRATVREGALINALRVEPELGSPARGGIPATTARHTADGWRLSGHKIYSTGAPLLRWGVVWAATDEAEPRVGQFLVPLASEGVRILSDTWDHLGLRASGSHDVTFENVLIPEDHAVDVRPPSAWGPPAPLADLWLTVLLSGLYHGVARAARDWLVQWLNERTPSNLGAPLSTLPRLQEAVGHIQSLLQVNEALLNDITRRAEDRPDSIAPGDLGLVKYTVTTNAIQITQRALECVGNPGLSRRHPLERYVRDALCGRVHNPQNDLVLATAGRAALGVAVRGGR